MLRAVLVSTIAVLSISWFILGQAIAGEMSLDDALKRITADIDEQVKAAGK